MLSVFRVGRVKKKIFFVRANGEVVLGGTGYHNNFDLRVSADDTRHILEATSQLIPSLKVSKISARHVLIIGLLPHVLYTFLKSICLHLVRIQVIVCFKFQFNLELLSALLESKLQPDILLYLFFIIRELVYQRHGQDSDLHVQLSGWKKNSRNSKTSLEKKELLKQELKSSIRALLNKHSN